MKTSKTLFIISLLALSAFSAVVEDEDVEISNANMNGNTYKNCTVTISQAEMSDITFEGGEVDSSQENSQRITYKDLNLTSSQAVHSDCDITNVNASYSQLNVEDSRFSDSNITISQGQIHQDSVISDTEIRICKAQISGSELTGGSIHIIEGSMSDMTISDTVIILDNSQLTSSTMSGGVVCLKNGASTSEVTFDGTDQEGNDTICNSITNNLCVSVEEEDSDSESSDSDDEVDVKVLINLEIKYEIEITDFENNDYKAVFISLIKALFEAPQKIEVVIHRLEEGSTIVHGDVRTTSPLVEAKDAISTMDNADDEDIAIAGVSPSYVKYYEPKQSNRYGGKTNHGALKYGLPLVFIGGLIFCGIIYIAEKRAVQQPSSNYQRNGSSSSNMGGNFGPNPIQHREPPKPKHSIENLEDKMQQQQQHQTPEDQHHDYPHDNTDEQFNKNQGGSNLGEINLGVDDSEDL